MGDIFTKAKRSAVMAAIASKGNATTELAFVRILRKSKINGWRRHLPLPGKPDFAFPKLKIAVFVDGCFWHGCPKHGRKPGSNSGYWHPKLIRTKNRDRKLARELRKRGWRVIRFWEHQIRSAPDSCVTALMAASLTAQHGHVLHKRWAGPTKNRALRAVDY